MHFRIGMHFSGLAFVVLEFFWIVVWFALTIWYNTSYWYATVPPIPTSTVVLEESLYTLALRLIGVAIIFASAIKLHHKYHQRLRAKESGEPVKAQKESEEQNEAHWIWGIFVLFGVFATVRPLILSWIAFYDPARGSYWMAHAAITTSAIILSGLEFLWYFGMLFFLNCSCHVTGKKHYGTKREENVEDMRYQALQTVRLKNK